MSLRIRFAAAADAAIVHRFIVELAVYEREPDAVEVDPETLARQIASDPPPFECLLAEDDSGPVGIAVFFHNYSTWRGRRGLYLEDLFVPPARRGRGVGKALLVKLAAIAAERDCARMEWSVLDWNELAHGFYRSIGARPNSGWTTWRLTGEPLRALAGR